jgi:hypothetical protein
LAEPQTPWLYPYREDPQQTRLGQPVFRPFVPVSFAANNASTPELEGLIDTGAHAILASDLLADEVGLDLADNEGEELHAVGGRTVLARYKTVSLRLHHHDDSGAEASGKLRSDSSMRCRSPNRVTDQVRGLVPRG